MARAVSFVSILGRLNPAIYDVIFPHGPLLFGRGAAGLHDRVSAVALNPQPLPPGPDDLSIDFIALNPQPLPPAAG